MNRLVQVGIILAGWWSLAVAEKEPPAELAKLQEQYGAAVVKVSAPLMKKLDADLKQLQDSFLRAEQIDAAQAVAEVRKSGIPDEGVEGLPERLKTLIDRFDSRRASALRPVEQTYLRELKKLVQEFAQAGDLESIQVVNEALKSAEGNAAGKVQPAKEFGVESLAGEWDVYFDGKLQEDRRSFDETHMLVRQGSRYPWKFVQGGKAIVINFGRDGKHFEKLRIDPARHHYLEGENHVGNSIHYLRPGHELPESALKK